jgi:PAS domain S-box-containing protein/diguanylate cyclase (GGDEF)-like protein
LEFINNYFSLIEIFAITTTVILYLVVFGFYQKSNKHLEIFFMVSAFLTIFGLYANLFGEATLFVSFGNLFSSFLALFHFKKSGRLLLRNFKYYLGYITALSVLVYLLGTPKQIVFLDIIASIIFVFVAIELFSTYHKTKVGNYSLFALAYLFLAMDSFLISQSYSFEFFIMAFYFIGMILIYQYIQQNDKSLRDLSNFYNEYQKAFQNGSIVSKTDKHGYITQVSKNLVELSGYTEKELIGKSHSIFKDSETPQEVYQELWQTITNGQVWKGVLRNVAKNGEYFHIKISIFPIFDRSGCIKEYISCREDITELVNSQTELKDIHNRDTLTSFGNRYKLFSDLVVKGDTILALINIDSFKEINDFYGEDMGDELIRETGEYLYSRVIRYKYRVYRVQADEFAIIPSRKELDNPRFRAVISTVVEDIKTHKFSLGNVGIFINVSAGVSQGQGKKLFKKADIALKTAKKNQVDTLTYSPDLKVEEIYESNLIWTRKIKSAIAEDRIVPYFQPLYNIKEGKATKFEVLMRLITKDGRVITPFAFLDVAKKSKLYFQLTTIIFDKVVEQIEKYPDCEFSMNLSSEDVMNDSLLRYIKKEVKNKKIGSKLIFEIVESEGIENFEEIDEFISWAKENGIRIAIDDFGTGYSNFTYLVKLEADFVKIDGSMIKNIDKDMNSRAVVEAILQFTKHSKMQVVAEFVASKEIFKIVEELGIDFAQGYYIDKPRASIDEINKNLII